MAKRKSMHIQSLSFKKPLFTVAKARAWANKRGFNSRKAHVVKSYIKLRQFEPKYFTKTSFRTKELTKGILATMAKLKSGYEIY